ncbi:MAG: pantetheine-phosphate adenylyltransferase [Bacteroidia bacterium]|nr:pantetheine-phosphate adenylyltransferase [Bacteroidia bacterium]
MQKIAVFPGSFDPFTKGHENVITRALPLFDKIYIAIGHNSEKKSFFTLDQRLRMIGKFYQEEPRIVMDYYEGLTVDYCKKVGAQYLLRGLRTSADFEFERSIAQINRKMNPEVETVFILAVPEFAPVNSTIIREILRYGGDASQFLPDKMVIED